MIVMRIGGSSVANAERIRHVASIIKAYADRKPVVVLSAMGDTTDYLLEAAELALSGVVDISNVENLHRTTAKELNISVDNFEKLLDELKFLLTGISMLHELTKEQEIISFLLASVLLCE